MAEIKRAKIGSTILDLVQGDITKQEVDAIVNAANSWLQHGGGVDGAIHRAAGTELQAELNERYNGCPTGEARMTKGYKLPAKYVIHAVGPMYANAIEPAKLLVSAYRYSLKLAHEANLKSVAFPAISTGVFGYPLHEAAPIALKTVVDYINEHQPQFELVRFVLFSADAMTAFSKALYTLVQEREGLDSA
jgi:O-acetyl-ADP-ribose deacetylase (regulator of RNase III)